MHDWREEDRRQRERLERNSSAGQRADIAGALNKLAAGSAAKERAGVAALLLLREAQQAHGRHIRELNRAHDRGGFDRLHPDSSMRRRVPASPTNDIPAAERDDARDDRIGPELRAGRLAADGGMSDGGACGGGGQGVAILVRVASPMTEAEIESEAVTVLLGYIGQLENAILLAAEELRGGDARYAGRVLAMMEGRIRASMEAGKAATAAEERRGTLH